MLPGNLPICYQGSLLLARPPLPSGPYSIQHCGMLILDLTPLRLWVSSTYHLKAELTPCAPSKALEQRVEAWRRTLFTFYCKKKKKKKHLVYTVLLPAVSQEKIIQRRFRLDIRYILFFQRVVVHWYTLPREWWGHCPWRCSRTMGMWH